MLTNVLQFLYLHNGSLAAAWLGLLLAMYDTQHFYKNSHRLINVQKGTPFPKYFSKVDRRFEFPVRTTACAFVFVTLYGLLYLASTTAFNSIVTSAVLFLNITYAVPQGILIVRGRKEHLPPRYLNLGIFGYICNTFSILWIVVLGVAVCMPPSLPVAMDTMNYTSVIVVGLLVIIMILWLVDGRQKFEGPHIDWDLIKEANSQMLHETHHHHHGQV